MAFRVDRSKYDERTTSPPSLSPGLVWFRFDLGEFYYSPDGVLILPFSGAGLTEPQHELLDTLAHEVVEDSHAEYTYSGSKITNITTYTDITKSTKIRETQTSYTGNKVTQLVSIQYDGAGVESYRLTTTLSYSGGKVSGSTVVRTP